jgi:regulator of chromosome condensation
LLHVLNPQKPATRASGVNFYRCVALDVFDCFSTADSVYSCHRPSSLPRPEAAQSASLHSALRKLKLIRKPDAIMPSKIASSAPRATAAKKSEESTANGAMAANTSKKRKSPVGDDVEDEVTDKMAKLNTAAAVKSGAGTNTVAKRAAVKKDVAAAPDAKKRKVAATSVAAKTASAKKPAAKKAAQLDESDKENEGAPKKAAAGKRKAPTAAPAAPAAAQTNGVADESQKDEEGEDGDDDEKPGEKRQKKSPAPKEPAAKKRAVRRKTAVINTAPTEILDVFVFGEGSNGELGLGNAKIDGKKPRDVKRPRLNPNLAAKTAKVVQVACGGMHVAALTADNKILTWGVNDMGALGRDTRWGGGTRDIDDEEDEDDGDDFSGMNPIESTPGEVDMSLVEPETVFTQVVASDSATFAVTEEGRVYGWGTFRVSLLCCTILCHLWLTDFRMTKASSVSTRQP